MPDSFHAAHDEHEKLRRKAIDMETSLQTAWARFQERHIQRWRDYAGVTFDRMLESRLVAEQFLTDSDARLRAAAYFLVAQVWGPDLSRVETYWHAALHDPDHLVRNGALSCLCTLYRGSANRRLGITLARIVKDESATISSRKDAYVGLIRLHGAPISTELLAAIRNCREHLPAGMDWALVDSVLSQSVGGDDESPLLQPSGLSDNPPFSSAAHSAETPAEDGQRDVY